MTYNVLVRADLEEVATINFRHILHVSVCPVHLSGCWATISSRTKYKGRYKQEEVHNEDRKPPAKIMTTVEFGGGPSLHQRRGFTALRDGTHVPGYRGYCPQIKYRSTLHVYPSQSVTPGDEQVPVIQLRNTMPKSTGDNKYTESMVPGYTGYIPRMTFKFGGTYKTECDNCIDEYMTNRQNHDLRQGDLRRSVTMVPRLTAVSHDPTDRRPLTEPPMPGYNGYIPRVKPTELGLGHRYHVACDNGFSQFVRETAKHAENTSGTLPRALERRLYKHDGMIPKYTGYIPHRRFIFGNTYGDTTRSLSVCAHDAPSYADYVQQKSGN
ncbi:CJ082-like protein [Mya arenaria]|uniref:CJ082-like protein n=1 Tax=Mya arenaria TaxID=6604 RepID=A0ABY7GCJ3_MYAAR|nr:CJ082-like protein [Mya arenaria]